MRAAFRRTSTILAIACLAIVVASCGGQQQSSAPKDEASSPSEEPAPSTPPAQQPVETAQADHAAPPPASEPPPAPPKKPSKPPAPPAEKTVEPAPPPPPPPQPIVKTVPSGTVIEVAFLDGVSSAASKAGDSFRTRVSKDVMIDGIPVIPAGSVIAGTVTEAVSLKKIGGKAKLTLDFSRLELTSGRTALVHATMTQIGKSETKKDAATIGGAAAGGAILGRVLSHGDKTKGTVIGALAGAAAGTVIAAKTEGKELEIPAGTESSLTLDQPTEVTVQP